MLPLKNLKNGKMNRGSYYMIFSLLLYMLVEFFRHFNFFAYFSMSKYFLQHLRILPLEDKLKLEKICYLLYMSYLIQFHRLKAKDFRSKTGTC